MNDPNGWVLTARARRDFKQVDQQVQRRIITALDRFAADPSSGDVKKLAGHDNQWRLRVGDWRIRFTRDTDTQTILVLRVLPRGRAYRD